MANKVLDVSSADLRRAAEYKEQVERLNQQIAQALHLNNTTIQLPAPQPVKKLHWSQTPEGRERIKRRVTNYWKRRRTPISATPDI